MTNITVKPGKYRHFKTNNLYEVIDVALHTETLEEMVVYKALYYSEKYGDASMWVRPKKMFLEDVEFNGKTVQRFQPVVVVE